jgi:hypothetical protein
MRVIAAIFLVLHALAAIAQAQPERWLDHAQPGGGVMPLPAGYTIVEQASDAIAKSLSDGITSYSQPLVNAKGLNNKIINSIKTSRNWRQDASGKVLEERPTKPEEVIRSLPDLMRQQGIVLEVIDGPKAFTAGAITGWRVSAKFNNDASRMDQFALLKGGILYTMSAAYQIGGADYWTPKTDEIVGKWQPAAVVGDLSAIAKPPPSTEWQAVAVKTGERFMLPPTWVVVARDEAPERESADGQTVNVHRLLNMRPSRAQGDVSTVNVFSFSVEDSTTKRAVTVMDGDLAELHDSMASGTGPSMKPAKSGGATRRQVAGAPAYFTALVAEPGTGIAVEGFLLSTIRGDRAYLFMATFPPGQSAEFEATISDILNRSAFVASSAKPAAVGTLPPGATAPASAVGSMFDPTMLLVSFLLTWGIGLTPPLLIRYAILRRPLLNKFSAGAIAGGFLIVNIVIFTALGSKSKTNGALMLVCFASYYILRQGAARYAGASQSGIGSDGKSSSDAAVEQAAEEKLRASRYWLAVLEPTKPEGWKDEAKTARREMRDMETVLPTKTVESLLTERPAAQVAATPVIDKPQQPEATPVPPPSATASAPVPPPSPAVPKGTRRTWVPAIVVGAVLLVVSCVAWFVWPTPYRFDTMRSGSSSVPVRINRFSGEAERLTVVGWRAMQSSPATATEAVRLMPAELAKLTGTAGIADYGWINADIYNGNDFDLGYVVISVTVTNADGSAVFTRDYRLSSTGGQPLQSSSFIADAGYRMQPGQKFSWFIKSAERE